MHSSPPAGSRRLTDRPIDVALLVREVAGVEQGGVCTFLGTARRHSDGKEVELLRYEAYPAMAEKVIEEIVGAAMVKFPDTRVTAIHRLGPCPLGEASVAVVAAAPHRDAAFAACRFVIDAIKSEAPIWKQELFRDGTAWVGDPGSFSREGARKLMPSLCFRATLALALAWPSGMALAPAQDAEAAGDLAELKTLETSLRRGQLGRETSEALEEYVGDFPNSARAHALRAELARRKGNYEHAEEAIQSALASPLRDAAGRVAVAVAAFDLHFERGDFDACGRDLDFGLEGADLADHTLAPIFSRRIVLLAGSGRGKEARRAFAERFKDAARSKDDVPYSLEAGRALLAIHELRRAAETLSPVEKSWRDASDVRQGEALLLLGRVYRLGHSGGDALPAISALDAALKFDPNSVDAEIELARARLFRLDADKADEAVEAALGVNGRSPDAWSTRAEVLLLQQRASEALAAAENALRENPRHGPALATKVSALRILGRQEDAKEFLARLLAAEPDRGENLCRIADIECYLNRFRDAMPIYRQAVAIDPAWSASWVGLSRCLVNTGDLEGALDALQQFRRVDDVPHMLADNTQNALRTLSGFVEVKHGNFTYVMHPLESPVLVPLLDHLYASVWPDLCSRYGFDVRTPVRVECFPKHNDFSARTVGFTGFGALGVCFGDVFTLLSPRSEMRGQFGFDKTAVHELTHVVTLGLSRNKVPRWLTEGISVHEEHVFAANGDREMDLDLFNYFKSGEIVPVRELNRLFGGPKILFGYYQGGLLADYLVEQRGEGVLHEMLEHFARDEEAPAVVKAVLGITSEELDRQFLAWLDRTRIAVMTVQPTYTEQGRRRLLERMRALPAGVKPDAELCAQIAWAYHRTGRPVDRDDFLNQALRADPRLPAAHFLLAERALAARGRDEKARREEARKELEAGFEAGGEEFFALLRYADLLAREGGASGEGDANGGGGGHRPGHPHGAEGGHGDDLGSGGDGPPELDAAERALRERLLELLERAKKCFPRYVAENNPYLSRARLLKELGREPEALDELRAFCDIQESDVPARRILVKRALELENWKEAKRYLLELSMIDPFVRQTWRDLARCDQRLDAPAEAIASLERALLIDPSTEPDYDPDPSAPPDDDVEARTRAELLLDLAELRLDVGEQAAAERALTEARGLKPDPARLEALTKRAQGDAKGDR